MKEGNGALDLVLLEEKVTPNHHKLGRNFVLLDNVDVSEDGSTGLHRRSLRAQTSVRSQWDLHVECTQNMGILLKAHERRLAAFSGKRGIFL